ncbi:MAG: zf-HC2 domain-containing protein [Synechococcales cyanobacterium]
MTPWQAWDDDTRWEMLSAYVDGELSGDELAQVEAWLASDPLARQELHHLQHLQAVVQRLPAPPSPSAPVIDAVMARLSAPPRRRRWTGTLVASLGVMALSGGALWRVLYPQPLVSIESPPVHVTLRPVPPLLPRLTCSPPREVLIRL